MKAVLQMMKHDRQFLRQYFLDNFQYPLMKFIIFSFIHLFRGQYSNYEVIDEVK